MPWVANTLGSPGPIAVHVVRIGTLCGHAERCMCVLGAKTQSNRVKQLNDKQS